MMHMCDPLTRCDVTKSHNCRWDYWRGVSGALFSVGGRSFCWSGLTFNFQVNYMHDNLHKTLKERKKHNWSPLMFFFFKKQISAFPKMTNAEEKSFFPTSSLNANMFHLVEASVVRGKPLSESGVVAHTDRGWWGSVREDCETGVNTTGFCYSCHSVHCGSALSSLLSVACTWLNLSVRYPILWLN